MAKARTSNTEELFPFSKWGDDDGDVLWWRFPITEPPYVGSPLDLGFPIGAHIFDQFGEPIATTNAYVGGWPFLDPDAGDLFWQRIPTPDDPREQGDR